MKLDIRKHKVEPSKQGREHWAWMDIPPMNVLLSCFVLFDHLHHYFKDEAIDKLP